MVLVRRLGGWRPTEEANGVGSVRLGEAVVEEVKYTFTVWHQLAQGFHGPYRAEGRLLGLTEEQLAPLVAQDVVLELDDGRFLPARVLPFGRLVAHSAPSDTDPTADPFA